MFDGLSKRQMSFCIKKKKFFGQTKLEEKPLALTALGQHSVLNRQIELQGARLTVGLMLNKPTKGKEFE